MRVTNEVIFSNGNMSGSLTSVAYPISSVVGWAAQFVYTGSPNGTLKVQISCDADAPLNSTTASRPTNWSDLGGSSVTIAAAGDNAYNVDLSYYNWIRFVYTASSGSGTINGRANLKGI